jgi:hypothetical protein
VWRLDNPSHDEHRDTSQVTYKSKKKHSLSDPKIQVVEKGPIRSLRTSRRLRRFVSSSSSWRWLTTQLSRHNVTVILSITFPHSDNYLPHILVISIFPRLLLYSSREDNITIIFPFLPFPYLLPPILCTRITQQRYLVHCSFLCDSVSGFAQFTLFFYNYKRYSPRLSQSTNSPCAYSRLYLCTFGLGAYYTWSHLNCPCHLIFSYPGYSYQFSTSFTASYSYPC